MAESTTAYEKWNNWESGDCLFAPGQPSKSLDQSEIINRLASEFGNVMSDWNAGDRWASARIAKAVQAGYSGLLLDAEKALLGCTVLVSIVESSGSEAFKVEFFMTPDTGTLELHYEPASFLEPCRKIAAVAAAVLEYELDY